MKGESMPEKIQSAPDATLPILALPDTHEQVDLLARRYLEANGILMQFVSFVGGQVEDAVTRLPTHFQDRIENATQTALEVAYGAAHGSQRLTRAGDRRHRMTAVAFGALGGLGGLPSALTELPVTTTLILRSIQEIASGYGEDLSLEETRLACLAVLGAGGPFSEDDGVDFAFLGARVALTGPAVSTLISTVAPRFASALIQKLGSKSIPLIGSLAGAGTNLAFMKYYQEMAHVHFGLRCLVQNGIIEAPSAFKERIENIRKN